MENYYMIGNLFLKKPIPLTYEERETLITKGYLDTGIEYEIYEGDPDITQLNKIYVLCSDGNNLFLNIRNDSGGLSDQRINITLDTLMNEYISLKEFLEKATFVGKKATKNDGDLNPSYNLLYVGEDHSLIIFDNEDQFGAAAFAKGNFPIQILPFGGLDNWTIEGEITSIDSNIVNQNINDLLNEIEKEIPLPKNK